MLIKQARAVCSAVVQWCIFHASRLEDTGQLCSSGSEQ